MNFWASWCVPCRDEAPVLQQTYERYRDRGLVVLGVDVNDFRQDARGFMERYGVTYPVVYDGKGSTVGKWGVRAFPETFFVDRSGKLVGERIAGRGRHRAQPRRLRARRRARTRRDAVRAALAALVAVIALAGGAATALAAPSPFRPRGGARLPDLQDDARPVRRPDRPADEADHPRAARGGRDRGPDQGRARRPVRVRRARGAAEVGPRPSRVGRPARSRRPRSGRRRRDRMGLEPPPRHRAGGGEELDPALARRVDAELERFDE